MAESKSPPAGEDSTATHCTVHSDRETLLSCIRCERAYCRECMEHVEAGLICHECLGLPPPEVQRRNLAIREVVFLTGIASIFGLVQLLLSSLGQIPMILIGVLAGWLMGRRLRGQWQPDRRSNVLTLGGSGAVAGTILAAMVVAGLGGLGVISLGGGSGGLEITIALVLQSTFYLVGTIAGLLWSVTRR